MSVYSLVPSGDNKIGSGYHWRTLDGGILGALQETNSTKVLRYGGGIDISSISHITECVSESDTYCVFGIVTADPSTDSVFTASIVDSACNNICNNNNNNNNNNNRDLDYNTRLAFKTRKSQQDSLSLTSLPIQRPLLSSRLKYDDILRHNMCLLYNDEAAVYEYVTAGMSTLSPIPYYICLYAARYMKCVDVTEVLKFCVAKRGMIARACPDIIRERIGKQVVNVNRVSHGGVQLFSHNMMRIDGPTSDMVTFLTNIALDFIRVFISGGWPVYFAITSHPAFKKMDQRVLYHYQQILSCSTSNLTKLRSMYISKIGSSSLNNVLVKDSLVKCLEYGFATNECNNVIGMGFATPGLGIHYFMSVVPLNIFKSEMAVLHRPDLSVLSNVPFKACVPIYNKVVNKRFEYVKNDQPKKFLHCVSGSAKNLVFLHQFVLGLPTRVHHVVYIGSGTGVTSVPVALAYPHIKFTLYDPNVMTVSALCKEYSIQLTELNNMTVNRCLFCDDNIINDPNVAYYMDVFNNDLGRIEGVYDSYKWQSDTVRKINVLSFTSMKIRIPYDEDNMAVYDMSLPPTLYLSVMRSSTECHTFGTAAEHILGDSFSTIDIDAKIQRFKHVERSGWFPDIVKQNISSWSGVGCYCWDCAAYQIYTNGVMVSGASHTGKTIMQVFELVNPPVLSRYRVENLSPVSATRSVLRDDTYDHDYDDE